MAEQTTEFSCEVREVFSGDDLMALIDLGVDNLWKKQRVRLAGVDTPNAVKAAGDTEAGQIRRYVRTMVKNRRAKLSVVNKFNNSWVVVLHVETGEGWVNVNQHLIDKGYVFNKK